jgi:hypothetical protein
MQYLQIWMSWILPTPILFLNHRVPLLICLTMGKIATNDRAFDSDFEPREGSGWA